MNVKDVEAILANDKNQKNLNPVNLQDIRSLNDISLSDRLNICLIESNDNILYKMEFFKRDLNYAELNEKLKGSTLHPYLNLLIEYQNLYLSVREAKEYVAKKLYENYRDSTEDEQIFTKLLKLLNEKLDLSYGINITFTNSSRKKVEVRDKQYLKYIYETTIKYYKDRGFNKNNLTYDEALEMLRQNIFKKDLILAYKQNNINPADIDLDNIPDVVIETFSKSIVTQREIDDKFLSAKIEDNKKMLEQFKEAANPGRKYLNEEVARFSLNLSYLIRLERFVEQDDVDNIFDMKLKNDELSLIYEYIIFWGLRNQKELVSGFNNVDNWIRKYKILKPEARNRENVKRINEIRTIIKSQK